MATADQIKALLQSHSERDDSRFYSIAMQVAANEARKGNRVLADDIRRMIDRFRAKAGSTSAPVVSIASPEGELQGLLSMSTSQYRLNDMVLTESIHKNLTRILNEQKHLQKIRAHGLEPRRKLLLSGPPPAVVKQ